MNYLLPILVSVLALAVMGLAINYLLTIVVSVLALAVMGRCICTLYHLKRRHSSLPHWHFFTIGFGNILMATAAFQAIALAIEGRLPFVGLIFLAAVSIFLFIERRRT